MTPDAIFIDNINVSQKKTKINCQSGCEILEDFVKTEQNLKGEKTLFAMATAPPQLNRMMNNNHGARSPNRGQQNNDSRRGDGNHQGNHQGSHQGNHQVNHQGRGDRNGPHQQQRDGPGSYHHGHYGGGYRGSGGYGSRQYSRQKDFERPAPKPAAPLPKPSPIDME